MTTVDNIEREAGFEEAFFPTLLAHTADAHRTESFGCQADNGSQPETVLVPARSRRLHSLVSMSLRNGAERISDVLDL